MELQHVADVPDLGLAIDVELTTQDAIATATEFGRCIAEARSLEELAAVQAGLDEGIGALLAQEQILIRRREILQLQKGSGR